MTDSSLNWAKSRMIGGVAEIALLTPIIPGRIPGERRTYEERLRSVLATLAQRVEARLPTPLSQINTFHFARVLILRPEQYLLNSHLPAPMEYQEYPSPVPHMGRQPPTRRVPRALEAYHEPGAANPVADWQLRSWLLTLVIFDGDPRVYVRDVSEFIERQFDLVFENCEDYPGARDFEVFWTWVRRHQLPVDVFYPAYPDLSVARIRQLEDFKRRFDAFVQRVRTPTGRRVERMDDLFDAFLRGTQQHASGFPAAGGVFETMREPDQES